MYESRGKKLEEDAENALLASMTCIKQATIHLQKPINIMMCITYQTMWLYNELTGQEEENEELLLIMKNIVKNLIGIVCMKRWKKRTV